MKSRGALVPRRLAWANGGGGGCGKRGEEEFASFILRGTDLELGAESVSSEWTTESEPEAPGKPVASATHKVAAGAAPPPSEAVAEKRRKRIRNFRIKRRLTNQGLSDSENSSDSGSSRSSGSRASSSTSDGSSSTDGGEAEAFKRQRVKTLQQWKAAQVAAAGAAGGPPAPPPPPPVATAPPPPAAAPPVAYAPPELLATQAPQAAAATSAGAAFATQRPAPPSDAAAGGPPPARGGGGAASEARGPPAQLEWFGARKSYRCFALARGFLSLDEIQAIHAAAQHPSVTEINDRKGYLAFKHRVWRFEAQLRVLFPRLYFRLFELMAQADAEKWRRLYRNSRKKKKVYPEIEYIAYDVAEMGEPCFIEPHVDNKSAVTMVCLLSDPSAFVGGRSCFRRAEGRAGSREVQLRQGDVALFRGEKLSHWITPVTAGRRVILQIELSRV